MTKYRQTFTIEFDPDDGPGMSQLSRQTLGLPVHETQQAGSAEHRGLSWTAPELIIEVPTGIGAVVFHDDESWIRNYDGTEAAAWRNDYSGNWKSDEEILDLLKAGADIKSHGVDL